MKKCPYCAEDIQDGAIKCKHCKEWLENDVERKEEDVQGADKDTERVKFNEKDIYLNKFKPLKDKSKYGWGWIILLVFFISWYESVVEATIMMDSGIWLDFIIFILPIFFFILYFKLRNKVIYKRYPGMKQWVISLISGIIVYSTFFISTFILVLLVKL